MNPTKPESKLKRLRANRLFLPSLVVILFGFIGVGYILLTNATSNYGPIVGIASKCVDNKANLKKANNPIRLYSCNGSGAQDWLANLSGAITNANGYCLSATSTEARSLVVLNSCTGSNLQKWVINSSTKSIGLKGTTLCLDSQYGRSDDRNPIWLYECNSTVAQRWDVKGIETPPAPVISSFSASPTSVKNGATATLNWTTKDAATCSVTPSGPTDTTALSWTTPALKTAGIATYTIYCKNSVGAAVTKSASVTVEPAVVATSKALLGVYNGGPSTDDAAKTTFGSYPDISSTYYQSNQQSQVYNGEKARVDKGIAPLVTITSKGTTYLSDVANKSGTGWTWIQSYVASLKSLSDYASAKNVKVYATLDHEWEVKVNQATLTGASADATVYAKALSNFIALTRAQAPKVVTLYWYGGFDTAAIGSVASKLTVRPDMYSMDPYSGPSHSTNETFVQMGASKVSWLKAQSWYKGEPYGFSEFGARHTDAAMSTYFFKDLRKQSDELGLGFAVFFNRTDTNVVPLTAATYPLSTKAFSTSLLK